MASVHICCEIAGKVVRIEARAGARVAFDDTLGEGRHVATVRT